MPPQPAITAFAIAVAILLIGGAILIRLQRDRHHFRLMQLALERGITAFPGVPPGWLISMRIGCLVLVLGIGLIISGLLLHAPIRSAAAVTPNAAITPVPPPPAPSAADHPGDRHQNPPPPPNPEIERQHRAQNQDLAGLVCIGAGIILALLGIVRIVFARIERTYARESAPAISVPRPPVSPNA